MICYTVKMTRTGRCCLIKYLNDIRENLCEDLGEECCKLGESKCKGPEVACWRHSKQSRVTTKESEVHLEEQAAAAHALWAVVRKLDLIWSSMGILRGI